MQQSRYLLFQLLLSILLLAPRIASGQDLPILLRDDFDNNENKWPTKFDKGKIAFQDGQYLIEETSTSGGWNFYIYPFIETGADLVLECRLKWLGGSKTEGFGLLWGLEDVKNSNVFLITASGDYQIISRYKDQRKDITGLIKSDVINTGEQTNILKVVYRGQEVDFYINAVKVHTAAHMPLRGFGLGFEVNGRMKFAVDYLEFRQAQKERRLIKNYPENIARENLGGRSIANIPKSPL
ncbi:MAG: hypothetical protein HC913_23055 [Microscillaceae bacterium]|nr:hypothetical protein [Microscillaceae bacterium]